MQSRCLPLLHATLAFLATLVSFVMLSSVARADDSPTIAARLKCLSLGGPVSEVDLLLPNNNRLHLKMAAGYISLSSAYHGPATLTFVLPVSTPPAHGVANSMPSAVGSSPAKPVVLATVTLPPTGGDYLLLFSGDTVAANSLQVAAVPFSASDVPPSSCLIWNVTSRNLGVLLGGQKALLPPGQHELIKPTSSRADYFDFQVYDEHKGQVRPLLSGAQYLRANTRQLLFIVEKSPDRPAIMVRTIEELPEPPAPPARRVVANF